MLNPQLETFIRAADAGSFSKAAEQLYISPNAVIKQINLLEASLDLRLFIRTHRGITMTPAGESFYRDVKYMIKYTADSISRARDSLPERGRVIRIGTSLITPTQFLIELWPQIQTYCPNIEFRLVPFENTPENAREIMMNFGQNIDLVAGIYDIDLLRQRQCTGLELTKEPICCAVPFRHKLAMKERLSTQDLFGENLMLINRGWNTCMDRLRDDLEDKYPQITLVDFPFYDVGVFNRCESGNNILLAIKEWKNVHPLLKIIPVEWDYVISSGLIFSPIPSDTVREFILAVAKVYELEF